MSANHCLEALSIAERVAVQGFVILCDLAESETLQLSTAIRRAHPRKPVIVLAGANPADQFSPIGIVMTDLGRGRPECRIDLSVVISPATMSAD